MNDNDSQISPTFDVRGRTVTGILKTPADSNDPEYSVFFRFIFELDGDKYLRLGDAGYLPTEWITNIGLEHIDSNTTGFRTQETAHECIGHRISDLLECTKSKQVYLVLDNGLFLWATDEEGGTILELDTDERVNAGRTVALVSLCR